MTKFEEELKRPDNTGIEPFSKRDVDFSKIAEKFARGAQTLKNWREYADYKEHQLEQKDEQIQELKVALKEALDLQCEANNQAAKEYIDRCKAESKLKDLKSQLQQQALPVVPECVAEWYEEHKEDLEYAIYVFCGEFYRDSDRSTRELTDFEKWFDNENDKPIETLIRMKDGYQVKKPQLFYLNLPNVYGLKNNVFVSKVENGTIVEFSRGKDYALPLTEQEIKSIDERYWEFAVPVDGK